jgi:hypothetical protein
MGDQKEGDYIIKNLNAAILRLLDNCNPSHIFCILFTLLKKYKDSLFLPKLPNIILKCILKLSKIFKKSIVQLDFERLLLVMHEYLAEIDHSLKTQNDEIGIRLVKNVVNELVKIKKEQIWESYRIVEIHQLQDNFIQKWITVILKSIQDQEPASTFSGAQRTRGQSDEEIEQIM